MRARAKVIHKPEVARLRAAAGSVLYLALIGLLALGTAAAVRDSAASIGVVLGLPCMWFAARSAPKVFRAAAYPLMFVAVLGLLLTPVIGVESGGATRELHVFAGDEAVAVNERELLVETELLCLLEKHDTGRRHGPANNGFRAGVADAAQLRNKIRVVRRKRFEDRIEVAFLGHDLELLGRALTEAAGVGKEPDLPEPLLVEIVGGPL